MDLGMMVILVGLPLLALLSSAGYAYVDAPNYGMNPTKWAAISVLVPFFGFFAYLFERDERTADPDRDMFVDGVFEIHESRADDTLLTRGGPSRNATNGDEDDRAKSASDDRGEPSERQDQRGEQDNPDR